jgi:thiopurine S-methyltransferase
MDKHYWLSRWESGHIQFHRERPNELLEAHANELDGKRRVYVPLCGKSLDVHFLLERGHEVIGSELSPIAINALFADLKQNPCISQSGPFRVHTGDRLTVFEGDALALTSELMGGTVDAIYDRGSLVAVDPRSQRAELVESFRRVLRSPGGKLLQVVFTYDPSKMNGPPWSISEADIKRLYGPFGAIRHIAQRPEDIGPTMLAAGIDSLTEHLYAIDT